MSVVPATSRRSTSPAPGQPRANVENRRRKRASWRGYQSPNPCEPPERA
jgi:hypothetical protein